MIQVEPNDDQPETTLTVTPKVCPGFPDVLDYGQGSRWLSASPPYLVITPNGWGRGRDVCPFRAAFRGGGE